MPNNSDKQFKRAAVPNAKTWERVWDYRLDPYIDRQLGIALDEQYDWESGTGVFLIHSLKTDTTLGKLFFEYNRNLAITQLAAVKFARALGLLEEEK